MSMCVRIRIFWNFIWEVRVISANWFFRTVQRTDSQNDSVDSLSSVSILHFLKPSNKVWRRISLLWWRLINHVCNFMSCVLISLFESSGVYFRTESLLERIVLCTGSTDSLKRTDSKGRVLKSWTTVLDFAKRQDRNGFYLSFLAVWRFIEQWDHWCNGTVKLNSLLL